MIQHFQIDNLQSHTFFFASFHRISVCIDVASIGFLVGGTMETKSALLTEHLEQKVFHHLSTMLSLGLFPRQLHTSFPLHGTGRFV